MEVEHHDYPCQEYSYTTEEKYAESFGIIATCATEEEAKAKVKLYLEEEE